MRIPVNGIGILQAFVLWLLLTGCSTASSEAQTVYLTKTGSKYHAEGCRYLSRSKIPVTLAIAKEQGYEPCSVCSPETEISEKQPHTQDTVVRLRRVVQPEPKEEKPTRSTQSTSPSSQCTAFTKAGTRCKRTASTNGKCWQHQ
jgi:hypothetical protein